MRAAAASAAPWLQRLDRRAALRMLAAGSVWGVVVASGFVGYALWSCGELCIDDVALTTSTSIVAGILTIGPLAALGGGR
jgi:hypothetical protein